MNTFSVDPDGVILNCALGRDSASRGFVKTIAKLLMRVSMYADSMRGPDVSMLEAARSPLGRSGPEYPPPWIAARRSGP